MIHNQNHIIGHDPMFFAPDFIRLRESIEHAAKVILKNNYDLGLSLKAGFEVKNDDIMLQSSACTIPQEAGDDLLVVHRTIEERR